LPENIGKYSHIILQELSRMDRNPADILMAWIIAWGFAERTELLAKQIMRQVKVQLPDNFQQAYEQCIQMLSDPKFKEVAIKAFNMAITKYRVREDIKSVAYDAPTERVLEALNQIASQAPQSMHLNKLIKDVEDIIRIKGGTLPTMAPPQPAPQPAPAPTPAPAPAPQPAPEQITPPQPTPQPAPTPPSSQIAAPPEAPPTTAKPIAVQSPVSFALDKEAIEKIISDIISEKLEQIGDLSGSLSKLSDKITALDSEVKEIRDILDKLAGTVDSLNKAIEGISKRPSVVSGPPSAFVGARFPSEMIDTFKNALSFIGLKLDEVVLKKYLVRVEEKAARVPPPPPPRPKIEAPKPPKEEKAPEKIMPPPSVPIPEVPPTPKEAKIPSIAKPEETMEVKVGVKEIPQIPAPPEAIPELPKPEEVELVPPEVPKVEEIKEVDVYMTALGDLRKLTEILAPYKDKSKPFRWIVPISIGSTKYNLTIQGAVKGIPRSLQREIKEKTKGFLIIGAFTQDIIKSALNLIRIVSKVDFVIWCDENVPDEVKALQVPIEAGLVGTREDLLDLIKKALFKAYEAG